MPFVDGDYVPKDSDEIRDDIIEELKDRFGEDIDTTQYSVFTTISTVLAEVLHENQEHSMSALHDARFLETAEGENLEKVVEILGIDRKPSQKATGIQRFISEDYVSKSYKIQTGTTVQTNDTNPITFETVEPVSLHLYDDFDDGDINEYNGDTSSFNVQSTTAESGSALKSDQTDNVKIYDTYKNIRVGEKFRYNVYIPTNGIAEQLFAVQDSDSYYRIVLDSNNGTHKIEKIEDGSVTTLISNSVSIPNGSWITNVIDWKLLQDNNKIISKIIDSGGSEVHSHSTLDDTFLKGGFGFGSGDGNTNKYWDTLHSKEVSVKIRATSGGSSGNLGAKTLTVMPSPPVGVDSTTNPKVTGDVRYVDLNRDPLTVGLNEETDEELRKRADEITSIGASATENAIYSNVYDLDDVVGLDIEQNRTEVDNTGSGGLPPYSFELIVHGGAKKQIAKAIFEKKSITSRTYGGANGTKKTYDVTSSVSGETETIQFSRPPKVDIDLTIDIVYDKNGYIGKQAIKDKITEYIGGTNTEGVDINGTRVGEDVYIDKLNDIIVGEDTGVIGIGSISTTPSITTDSDGLEVVSIASNEVAITNARDGSITINETEQ